MTGPVVVLMAAVMALTALYCAGRLVAAPLLGRASQPGIDLLHVVMGLVMAAMLLGRLNQRWDLLWVVGFGTAALWFTRAGVVRTGRLHPARGAGRHHLQHGLACLAMVMMLVGGSPSAALAVAQPVNLEMGGMAMPAGGALSGGLPGAALAVVLAMGLLAFATVDAVRLSNTHAAGAARATKSRVQLAPRCATGCRLAMTATMAVALLTML